MSPSDHRLQEKDRFLLTPFERNIEVWRQLWRVLERSHLVVQIVDARNPLRFRCEDLESYVQDVEGAEGEAGTGKGKRRSLLLINKADLLTPKQRYCSDCSYGVRYSWTLYRRLWADYFDTQGINYAFFSAANAAALQEARREALARVEAENLEQADGEAHESSGHPPEATSEVSPENADVDSGSESSESMDELSEDDPVPDSGSESDDSLYRLPEEETGEDAQDPRVKVLSVLELEELFIRTAPDLNSE